MKIQWLGHSSFRLEESTGTAIVTDPYEGIGFDMPIVNADAITVSHSHDDHNNVNTVLGQPKIFNKDGVFELDGVTITGIKTFHDENEGELRGENIIYKFRMDGVEVCHLGDIGHEITSDLIETLVPVNVLLIPVGGKYTIDGEKAKEYIDALMPEIVIPMHYKVKNLRIDIDKVDLFLRHFEEDSILRPEEDFVEISREVLEEDQTKVVLLKRIKV